MREFIKHYPYRIAEGDVLSVAILKAAEEGKIETLLDANEDDWDVNLQSSDGMSLLAIAAEQGYDDIFLYLLNRGAFMYSLDMWGWTLLHSAATGGSVAIVKRLLELGFKVDHYDDDMKTALYYARAEGHEEIVKLLLKYGAREHWFDKDNNVDIIY